MTLNHDDDFQTRSDVQYRYDCGGSKNKWDRRLNLVPRWIISDLLWLVFDLRGTVISQSAPTIQNLPVTPTCMHIQIRQQLRFQC